ncbi:MAG: FkbM family methyltransferase [Puniceicoccales bacterium]|jgi:FkbM family methyltransferase|nr:FkbM family methyltransferase [Puniceicoccales bacterium]
MKRFLVNFLCACVPSKKIRHRIKDYFSISKGKNEKTALIDDGFMPILGVLSMGDQQLLQEYFLTHNMPEKINILKAGLDETSQKNIDRYLFRMLLLPDNKISANYKINKIFFESLKTEEEKECTRKFIQEYLQYKKDIVLFKEEYNVDTFYFHHGLRFQSKELKKYIAGKDFIDAGAYVGDSALILNKYYAPSHIWSFEISEHNRKTYQQVAKLNNLPENKYTLVPMGVSDTKKTIYIDDSGHQGTTTLLSGGTKCELTDLDSFVEENNLKVGFIKSDVEGSGLEALKGMKKTIRKDKPVLCLAIYHNLREFFDTKPMLEEIVGGEYKMIITQLHSFLEYQVEIVIFAYPKELDSAK